LLTDISLEEISEMKKKIATGDNPMEFKKQLAQTITEMYHNSEKAVAAAENFKITVQNKSASDITPNLVLQTNGDSSHNIATNASIFEIVKMAMPNESNSNIHRLIEQGAVSIDGEKITDPNGEITPKSGSILKTGKRNFYKIILK